MTNQMMKQAQKKNSSKHNKRRNTVILYEILVQELTSSIIKKEVGKQNEIISILKEFFKANKPLKNELILYETIKNCKGLDKVLAEKILQETKRQYDLLNKKDIFNQQTKLLNSINKKLSRNIFNNFIPDYKNLATISLVFRWRQ